MKQPIYIKSWRWTCKCPKHVEAIYEKKIIVKLFASSWYIFLTYIYDARSHLHQITCFMRLRSLPISPSLQCVSLKNKRYIKIHDELVDCVWNVMAHAHKPDFVFRRNGRVHLNRRGRHFSRMLAAEMCAISVSNAGYTTFRGSVKSTGYPLHSPVSPSLPIPCATVCHQVSNALYLHDRFLVDAFQLRILVPSALLM